MKSLGKWFALLMSLSACEQFSPGPGQIALSSVTAGAVQLGSLPEIKLGMSPGELREARRVQFAPYSGYVDSAGGTEFRFQFPKAGDQENQFRFERLEAVSASTRFPNDSLAVAAFRQKTATALASGRKPVACVEARDGSHSLIIEFEPTNGAYLQIGHWGATASLGPAAFERVSINQWLGNEGLVRRECSPSEVNGG